MFRVRRQKTFNDPVAVVNRFVDAANRHDADGIARCLHPDFESIQPVYPSRNFRGSDQVRRNWQSIFESEPGFRLSLVRASATDGTVWVELHGAGKDVEVAGVFIMGVEDELVRWARVYSAVIEQPAVVMDEGDKAPKMVAVPLDSQAEAEELRRMIEAGRVAAMGDTASVPSAATPVEAGSEEADGSGSDGSGADGSGAAGSGAAEGDAEELVGPTSAPDTDSDDANSGAAGAGDAPTTAAKIELVEGLSEGGSETAPAPGSADRDETVPAEAAEAAATGEAGPPPEVTSGGADASADGSGADASAESNTALAATESAGNEPGLDGGDTEAPSETTVGARADGPTPDEPDGPDDTDDATDQDTVAKISPAVAAVHALADADRGRQARKSLRENADNEETPDEPETDAAPATELDDAARVRAAARAATSKAAGISAPKPTGPGKGTGRKSRGGKPPRRG